MSRAGVTDDVEVPEPTVEEVSEGVFGYVQLDGSWGLNNTGFVVGKDAVVAVDTCFTERQSRAFPPGPGAGFACGGTGSKGRGAEVRAEATGVEPGEVIDGRLSIACGGGALRVLVAQREGKTAQETAEFLRGFKVGAGTVLPLPQGGGEGFGADAGGAGHGGGGG